ncbi:MAG TPA: Ig-like domain-containing protein [Gemmatimonadaceae bacterium]|nr:Ig-like domain-containing protein [Gemmatimonadaceae bacterium]
MGSPPGGPVRSTPAELIGVTPDSGAVNARVRSVVFTFDEVVNDREIEKYFMMSPEEGRTRVSWRRSRVEVKPRHGFRPNTAYSVTMLPGLQDLRGNTMRAGRTIVFSTGPSIPPYLVLGRAFDWLNERVAGKALVQVIRRPDSLPYVGVADSAGQFGIGPLAGAPYTVLAYMDNNNNRTLDRGEAWDSLSITVGGGASPFVELLLAPRDTFPPRLLTVTVSDTFTVVASFDRPINPEWEIRADRFRLVGSDSAALRIAGARRRSADSTSTLAPATGARPSQPGAAQPGAQQPGAAPQVSRAIRDTTASRDSILGRRGPVVAPTPKPSRPAPPREIVITLDSLTPMHPGRGYRLTAIDVRGLLGLPRTSERTFITPRLRVDTAKASDSTRARPGAPPRPPAGPPRKP